MVTVSLKSRHLRLIPAAFRLFQQNKVVINVYLPNGESSMYNLEGQMPIEDLFSKVCREENLKETFHTMQYLSSKGGTLSMDGKVSDLRSYELRFVDKRGKQNHSDIMFVERCNGYIECFYDSFIPLSDGNCLETCRQRQ